MVTVSECAAGGGIPTQGSGGKGPYCDGGAHNGKPIELIVRKPGMTPAQQIAEELASHSAQIRPKHR